MNKNHTLASLGFGNILAEHEASTATGKELFAKYQNFLMANPESHLLVNSFLKEARNCAYDKGVQAALNEICGYLAENKVSWQLATVCENIDNDKHTYNFLNKGAVNQVKALLEMNESEVVKYIKAGVLKNVMFVEGFRNVAKSVFNDRPVREEFANYSSVHPFSLLESNNGAQYFAVMNKIYKMDEAKNITEATANEVSESFKMIMNFVNSNRLKFENEALIYTAGNANYVIESAGKVIKETADGKKLEMTVEQFRENSEALTKSLLSINRNVMAQDLELFAQIAESFDDFCVLDNVNVITSRNSQFVVIEANNDQTYGIVESFNAVRPFRIEGNIMECVDYVKSHCNIDLSEKYENAIKTVVENEEHASKITMEQEIQESAIDKRRQKIAEMTERYKNDPAKLAVLSQCAAALNDL